MYPSQFGVRLLAFACLSIFCAPVCSQTPPTAQEIAAYTGLHDAAARGSTAEIEQLVADGADVNGRDALGRTPLMVAAYRHDVAAAGALIRAGANINALDYQSYDFITIAAVLNDIELVKLAIASGGNTRAITSPYGGTALIAAAHLGHAEVVEMLIATRAPVDHVNKLGWTALIEAIILGDGGPRYRATVETLVQGGADVNRADGQGVSPLSLARGRGYSNIADILERAGGKP